LPRSLSRNPNSSNELAAAFRDCHLIIQKTDSPWELRFSVPPLTGGWPVLHTLLHSGTSHESPARSTSLSPLGVAWQSVTETPSIYSTVLVLFSQVSKRWIACAQADHRIIDNPVREVMYDPVTNDLLVLASQGFAVDTADHRQRWPAATRQVRHRSDLPRGSSPGCPPRLSQVAPARHRRPPPIRGPTGLPVRRVRRILRRFGQNPLFSVFSWGNSSPVEPTGNATNRNSSLVSARFGASHNMVAACGAPVLHQWLALQPLESVQSSWWSLIRHRTFRKRF